jgi:OmpA-OmpF porin, OOP family
MSQSRVARTVAAAAAFSFFAAYAATAQSPPPGAAIYPVHFATGSSELDQGDQETIRGVAAVMQGNPALIATIEGKADTVGSQELNEKLSQRRAQAVFEALVYTNKVPENRVELKWTGEQLPTVSTADEEALRTNRVVEIFVR